ncbi:MAG: polysaccharide biosynthesis protein, partial [Balneolaceae bacterium]
ERYQPNIIFHAAAHKHVPIMEENPFEAVKNNIFGTLNTVNLAHEFKAERFVMVSTDKAVNPTSIMGATKRVCEIICQTIDKTSETDFVAVRFGNVLGSNGSVIPLFRKQLDEGGPLTVTHKDIIRYFMTIPEAVQLILQSVAFAQGGEIFVLDMGEPVKIDSLARDFIKLSGFEPDVDVRIVYSGLRPGEKLFEELLLEEEGLKETVHEKIFIGKPVEIEYSLLQRQLETLHGITEIEDEILLDSIIRVLVPTYAKPLEY